MQREILKSKIHRARITRVDLDYEGSLTCDPLLLKAADILPGEKVLVANLRNGKRFETYAIKGNEHRPRMYSLFFSLLTVKCPMIALDIGASVGDLVVCRRNVVLTQAEPGQVMARND